VHATRIAFASNRDGPLNFDVFAITAIGGATRLTTNRASDSFPDW
jgi:hypothetical protein